jgi:UDP-glucose 4-epimerase
MGQRILVTGGAGCIGSDLARVLVERGDEVVVFDNLSSGKWEHVEPLIEHPNFRFVEGDLLDRDALRSAMKGIGMVYHLAANPDIRFAPGDRTDKDLEQNTIATYHVLDAMAAGGVRRLAFASSSAVYGITDGKPIPEDFPRRPISLYGATKLGCEALIGAFQNLFGIQSWIFRFANIVGRKVRKSGRTVISDFIAKLQENPRRLEILGNGKQAKSYLLSGECIEAMLFAVEHARGELNVFNLGCRDQLAVDEIAGRVVAALGLDDVEFTYSGGEAGWPGDVPRFLLDVSAVGRLGWQAGHTSSQAVDIAIQAILANSREPQPQPEQPCKP